MALDWSPDTVGHGLRILETAGLVTNRRAGRVIYHRLADHFPTPREPCVRRLVEFTCSSIGEEFLTDKEH